MKGLARFIKRAAIARVREKQAKKASAAAMSRSKKGGKKP